MSESLLNLFDQAADAVADVVRARPMRSLRDRTGRVGQYALDVDADRVALEVLSATGLVVLSEESGINAPSSGRSGNSGGGPDSTDVTGSEGSEAATSEVIVVDPVDGSTNASRGLPWWATSICLVDHFGPRVAYVRNQASGVVFTAVRGDGAYANGRLIEGPLNDSLSASLMVLTGTPPSRLPWGQYRVLGAASLDLCLVAAGGADGFLDVTARGLAPWDVAAAVLVLTESGCDVSGIGGRRFDPVRDLVDPEARPRLTAGRPRLLAEVKEAVTAAGWFGDDHLVVDGAQV